MCVVLIVSACVTTAVRQTDLYKSYFDAPQAGTAGILEYELIGRTHVLRLSGDEYEMGIEYGKKARELGIEAIYAEVFDNATAMLADDAPDEYAQYIDIPMVKTLLSEAWTKMEPFVPKYMLQMLQGFSVGAEIDIKEVYAMHAMPDFTETSCSALWATGAATATGTTVQIRVLDYIMGLGIQNYPSVVYLNFDEGFTVANVGWLGLFGVISGMNAKGLAVSEMGYGNPPGENFEGAPMPFLLLDVLRWAANPQEATGIVRSSPRTNSYVYVVGSAKDGAVALITNAYEVISFIPGQIDAPVPQLTDSLQAGHYQDRMDQLVADRHGAIGAEWLMDEFIPAIAMDSNLQCVVYDLTNLRFYVANAPDRQRRAADQFYTEFIFPVEDVPSD